MRNLSSTKKGTGRVHKDGVKSPKKHKRFRQLGSFAQTLRDWITAKNLERIQEKAAKK